MVNTSGCNQYKACPSGAGGGKSSRGRHRPSFLHDPRGSQLSRKVTVHELEVKLRSDLKHKHVGAYWNSPTQRSAIKDAVRFNTGQRPSSPKMGSRYKHTGTPRRNR